MGSIMSLSGTMENNTEKIKFDLYFKSIFWDRPPVLEVQIDSETVHTAAADCTEYHIGFYKILDFKNHRLSIIRSNKSDDQCLVHDGEKKDQYVILERVCIDGIDIQNLVWHRSWYEPCYPSTWAAEQAANGILLEEKVIGETWLSHNGTWHFDFFSPFYKFLISQFENKHNDLGS